MSLSDIHHGDIIKTSHKQMVINQSIDNRVYIYTYIYILYIYTHVYLYIYIHVYIYKYKDPISSHNVYIIEHIYISILYSLYNNM